MEDFVAVNGVYANFFGEHKPARSAVEVARLPKDVLVEVECIARYVLACYVVRIWNECFSKLEVGDSRASSTEEPFTCKIE